MATRAHPGDEVPAFALPAEAEVLQCDQHGDREAVVDRDVLDVGRRHPRLCERVGTRGTGAGRGQVDPTGIGVLDARDRLTEDELIATIILLFAAGFETTTNLIGSGLITLLRNREQMAMLRERPSLAHGAVEEMLRFESSVQLDARTALEPAEVAGCTVEEGQMMLTLLGGASRDPVRFPDPDRFDVERPGTQHVSFAAGIHYCLGAPLPRHRRRHSPRVATEPDVAGTRDVAGHGVRSKPV